LFFEDFLQTFLRMTIHILKEWQRTTKSWDPYKFWLSESLVIALFMYIIEITWKCNIFDKVNFYNKALKTDCTNAISKNKMKFYYFFETNKSNYIIIYTNIYINEILNLVIILIQLTIIYISSFPFTTNFQKFPF
jgi:hypothetical protein